MRPEREILHVDDNPLMTAIVAELLKPYGYQVRECHQKPIQSSRNS